MFSAAPDLSYHPLHHLPMPSSPDLCYGPYPAVRSSFRPPFMPPLHPAPQSCTHATPRSATLRLTSKLFCICPRANQPRSPPFRALLQSDSVAAVSANARGRWAAGSAESAAMCCSIAAVAAGRERVMFSCAPSAGCSGRRGFEDV